MTSGSTWHAAGLCTQFNQSYNLMGLLKYSLDLYETLEAETGQAVDFHRCGSVRIGTTTDRLHQFEHVRGIAESVGVPVEIIAPERALELFPFAQPEGILAAAHLPTDGHVDPTGLTNALAKGATDRGATIVRHTPVTGLTRDGALWTVSTAAGDVKADHVVIAAGQWSRQVARLAGVDLPIVPLQHHYVLTEPIPEVESRSTELPVFRDPDNSFYARQEGGGLLVGPFEPNPKTWALDGVPDDFHGRLLPPDLDQIEGCLVAAAGRLPVFGEVGLATVINGPDGYTPDGKCLMGPVPGQPGLHVLAGFSIFGIVFGGGAGRYAAEWIVEGQPSDNMWELDFRRFGDYADDDLLRRRPRLGSLRGRVQDPLPGGGAARRPAAEDRPSLRATAREGCRDGCPLGLGAAALVLLDSVRRVTSTPSAAATGSRPSGRSAVPCAPASACSTRRASPSSRCLAKARPRCSIGCARTGSRPRSAASR